MNNNAVVKKMRSFFISESFMAIIFVFACIITTFRLEVIGTAVFCLLISFLLIVCDDLLTTTLPFLLLTQTVIKQYDSYDTFIGLIWIAVPVVAALVFHFVYYKHKLCKGKYFYAVLASSIAVTLGGAGFISAKEYFSLVSFYYVFGLGFGMLFIYVLLYSYIDVDRDYSVREKLTNIMLCVGLFACFMVIEHYLMNISEVLEVKGILYIQWRNNLSTFFLLAMPFTIMKAVKKSSYIFLPFLYYACMMLTGSRSGLLFGAIELLLTLFLLILLDKRHRVNFVALSIALLIFAVTLLINFYGFFQPLFERLFNAIVNSDGEGRSQLYKRALKDFFSNPVFGTGLAYMGNRDVHKSATFALCWYHCEPLQIIGSMGITGVVAFTFQAVSRCVILLKRRTLFNATILLSYVGLEMISLVNPGVFCPLPYLFLITMFIAVAEKIQDNPSRVMVNKKDEAADEIDKHMLGKDE